MHRSLGGDGMVKHLREWMDPKTDGHLRPEDFNLTELAVACFGWDRFQRARNDRTVLLTEAGDGVDSTTFSAITGLVVQGKVRESFLEESNQAASLIGYEPGIRNKSVRRPMFQNLDAKESGTDGGEDIKEGMPYPRIGFGADYQSFGDNRKRGNIIPVTREALFFDNTGEVLRQASQVGRIAGIRKDKTCWNAILGIQADAYRYSFNGTAYATYQAATPWINHHTPALVNWTDIDAAETLFVGMTDPNTGEPIELGGRTVLVMPQAYMTAQNVFGSNGTDQTSDANYVVGYPNPLAGYALMRMAARAYALAAAHATYAGSPTTPWIMGDLKKAFTYRENWPLTITQAPTNTQAEFESDIVAQFKASERGDTWVEEPRYVTRSLGTG